MDIEPIELTPEMIQEAHEAAGLSGYAKEVLDNPAYRKAMEIIKQSMFDLFKQPDLTPQQRESLWLYAQCFERMDGTLAAIYNGGEAAKIILANLPTKE
jgi:hypothetical protein